jgi:hypothetical protein
MQAWEKQFSKIIFQHEKPLVAITTIAARMPFNVHTFFGKYILKFTGGRSLASQARHQFVAQIGTFASRIVVTTPPLP